MTLKTTLDDLDTLHRIIDGASMESRSPVTVGQLCHDAKVAHKLLAEREWYRLLAWGLRTNNVRYFWRGKERGVFIGDAGRFEIRCDDLGLPVRTPELEQALRQALEESK